MTLLFVTGSPEIIKTRVINTFAASQPSHIKIETLLSVHMSIIYSYKGNSQFCIYLALYLISLLKSGKLDIFQNEICMI